MVLSMSIAGATPKLTRSDSESRSFPRGENALRRRASAPSAKSNTAAAAMEIMAQEAPSREPNVLSKLKDMNIATHPDMRLRHVTVLGMALTMRSSIFRRRM